MKERPILFSGPMVRAILDGRKSQTRRVVKLPQQYPAKPIHPTHESWIGRWQNGFVACPYGQPGDRIWCKETWQVLRETCSYETGEYDVREWEADLYGSPQTQLLKDCPRGGHRAVIAYRADYEESFEGPWRPSIFMPRWASRITLEVTGVRVERLQEISEADAIAEGIERSDGAWASYSPKFGRFMNPITSYHSLWESINGPGSWAANPWVWVIEFKRIHPTSEEGAGCVWSHIDNQRG